MTSCAACGQIFDSKYENMHFSDCIGKAVSNMTAPRASNTFDTYTPPDFTQLGSFIRLVGSKSKHSNSINKFVDKMLGTEQTTEEATSLEQKKCPDCAEMVLMEAKVCKHCRFRFDEI